MTEVGPLEIKLIAEGIEKVLSDLTNLSKKVDDIEKKMTASSQRESKKREDQNKKSSRTLEDIREQEYRSFVQKLEKETKAEERELRKREAEQKASLRRTLANQERERRYFAHRVGYGIGHHVMGAFGGVGRLVGGTLALGGGFGIAQSLQSELEAGRLAAGIDIQTRGQISRDQAMSQAHQFRRLYNTPLDQSLRATQALSVGTGDPRLVGALMPDIMRFSKAEGLDPEMLAGRMAKIKAENRGISDEQLMLMARMAAAQQKSTFGAISAEEMFEVAPTTMALAGRFSGSQTANQMKLFSLLNAVSTVTKSPAQAATDILAMEKTLGQKGTQKRLRGAGIDVVDPTTGLLRDPNVLLPMILGKLSNKQLGEIFEGRTAVTLAGLQQSAGLAPGDIKSGAATGKISRYLERTEAQVLSPEEIQRDLAKRMEEPAEKIDAALNRLKDAFSDPKLIDSAVSLADSLSKVAPYLADLANFAVEHPWITIFAGLGSAILRTIVSEIVSAKIGAFISSAIMSRPIQTAAESATARLLSGAGTPIVGVAGSKLGLPLGIALLTQVKSGEADIQDAADQAADEATEEGRRVAREFMLANISSPDAMRAREKALEAASKETDPSDWRKIRILDSAAQTIKDSLERTSIASITIQAQNVTLGGSAGPRGSTGPGFK